MRVPFYRPTIGDSEISEVVDTLRSGWLTTGPKTKQFEKEFGAYIGQKHAVALNSCTAALHLALEAIGLKAGQGVIVPTMTFAATAEVVRYFGARPILVDCRPEDLNLDVADAERKIEAALAEGIHVAAIIPVHYGGQIGDVYGIQALGQKYNLKVIEDAAHACPAFFEKAESRKQKAEIAKVLEQPPGLGLQVACPARTSAAFPADLPSRGSPLCAPRSVLPAPCSPLPAPCFAPVGHHADITCFSFYANKTITTGEGGMACTNNDDYADRMRIMSLHGISRDAWKRYTGEGNWYYEIIAPGFKYNLTDIAAAIGIHQLRKADALHRARIDLARAYAEALGNVDELVLPRQQPGRVHSWHLYSIRLRLDRLKLDRAQFIDELKTRGIGTSVHWLPLHMHPYYRDTYGYKPGDFPVAAGLYPELVTLPLFPGMTPEEINHVCSAIKEVLANEAL